MTRKFFTVAAFAGCVLMAGCDSSPIAPDDTRPQYDGRTRRTTSAPADTTVATTNSSGGNVGDPCDPATYVGPYNCVPDGRNGYIIAY